MDLEAEEEEEAVVVMSFAAFLFRRSVGSRLFDGAKGGKVLNGTWFHNVLRWL